MIISLLFEGLRFLNLFRAFNDRFLCHKTGKVILKMQIPPFVKFRGALLVGEKNCHDYRAEKGMDPHLFPICILA